MASETVNEITTTNYSYDNNNNILKSGLTYTNGVLTKINGMPISYDAMGNPTTYKGNQFIWKQGRKLTSGNYEWQLFLLCL